MFKKLLNIIFKYLMYLFFNLFIYFFVTIIIFNSKYLLDIIEGIINKSVMMWSRALDYINTAHKSI